MTHSPSLSRIIAPSLLSADLSDLRSEIASVESAGAEWLHVDVMDGHFVPNLTFGAPLVASIRPHTKLFIDCHLMVNAPENRIDEFAKAGAQNITVHAESTAHLHRLIQKVKSLHCDVGVSLNPATPLSALELILEDIDLVLIMSVNPGFGGQSFIEKSLEKIARLSEMRERIAKNEKFLIQVDGGVSEKNVAPLSKAGCNVFVAGSSIFGQKDRKKAIEALR